MNKHIEKYLDLYLDREDVEYATLLIGEWGCGKTFFIKNYIENIQKSQKDKHKFIYISLFGLKNISSVNEAIFEELHPILSNKKIKFLGGALKAAIKLGVNVNLIGDENKETKINIDFKNLNPFEKTAYEDLIFIFDDLERTLIPIIEILGFINSILDNKNVKVIIIANENEIKKEDEEIYNKFKEKIIDRSFKVKQDKNYWSYFKDKYESTFKKNENQIDLVKNIFENFGDNNYRNMNQCTDNYIYFTSRLDPYLLDNHKFSDLLIEQFYTLSLAHKKNDIESHLTLLDRSEYNILPKEMWLDIICGLNINYEKLNNSIPKLAIFNKTKEKSWERLRHYRELNKTEFTTNLEDVKNKFIKMHYNDIDILTMVISELIFFIKCKLCKDLSINDVIEKTKEYIEKLSKNNEATDFEYLAFNQTGLKYIDEGDNDFKKIKELLDDKYQEIETDRKNQKLISDFYELLPYIKLANWNELDKEYEKYKKTSFLGKDHAEKIINLLNESGDYAGLYNLYTFLDKRYQIINIGNSSSLPSIYFLLEESHFVYELIRCLEEKSRKESNPFYKLKLDEILVMLKQLTERFTIIKDEREDRSNSVI